MAVPAVLPPGVAPYAHDGGDRGLLLVHGFTGSPASMRPWGEHAAAQGWTVRVPRLPGHGTTWQEMNRTRWEDWYAEVDAALDELGDRCSQVVVGGLSMGGALALRLAAERPADVDALVLVNPAVSLVDRRLAALPVLRHVLASLPGIANDISKEGADERGYDRVPLHALWSQTRLWDDLRPTLHRVSCPLLLFRSRVDHVLDPSSARIVLAGVSSAVAEEVVLEHSFHVATLDHDAALIEETADAFLDRVLDDATTEEGAR